MLQQNLKSDHHHYYYFMPLTTQQLNLIRLKYKIQTEISKKRKKRKINKTTITTYQLRKIKL